MRKYSVEGIRLNRETLLNLDDSMLHLPLGGKTIAAPASWPLCTSACPSAVSCLTA